MTTKTPISTQQAKDIGKSGGTVNTNGMTYQVRTTVQKSATGAAG